MSTTLFDRLCSVEHLFRAWEHVKKKNAAGGVDGESVTGFEASLEDNLAGLAEELSAGKWIPQPYMRIEIPKKTNEKRRLGLLTVRDKIVQQGIRMLIEPRCERLFLNNSYGYRPGKGAVKAIRRALSERQRQGTDWALKLDIDDFFDNVDHEVLEARVSAVVNDSEILRLVMLSVKMGVVSKSMKWQDVAKGLPQGAVLSPVLANLYLHSFDQYITSKTQSYVRYADDFVIFASSREEAMLLCTGAEEYLKGRLKLRISRHDDKKRLLWNFRQQEGRNSCRNRLVFHRPGRACPQERQALGGNRCLLRSPSSGRGIAEDGCRFLFMLGE